SARNAAVAGRCAAAGGGLRRALQRCPPEQCHWLHHAEGQARRPSAGDPCGARSEAGGGTKTAADSSAGGRVKKRPKRPISPFSGRGGHSSKHYAVGEDLSDVPGTRQRCSEGPSRRAASELCMTRRL